MLLDRGSRGRDGCRRNRVRLCARDLGDTGEAWNQRRELGALIGRHRGDERVEHSGFLIGRAVGEQLAHQIPEVRGLIGSHDFRHALREHVGAASLRDLIEVRRDVCRRSPARGVLGQYAFHIVEKTHDLPPCLGWGRGASMHPVVVRFQRSSRPRM
jgi:hypothetical protein